MSDEERNEEGAMAAEQQMLRWTKPAMNGDLPPVRGGHGCVLAEMQLVVFGGHAYLGKGKFKESIYVARDE
jgi:hypothetical protein